MLKAAGALVLIAICGTAYADDVKDDAYKALTEVITITPRDANSDDCVMTASADFAKYTDRLPIFRDAFLNRDFSVDFYRQRQRQVFTYIVLKREAELMTEALYNVGKLQQECHFSISVSYDDKFGQSRSFQAVDWRFDKEQASKVNWEKFDPRNFDQVALDYHFSSRVSDWVANEPKMSDDNQSRRKTDSPDNCDMVMFNANAMFIRATTFCRKDYMDSKEGLAALAGARKCVGMGEEELKQKASIAMLTLDRIATEHGRSAVCPFVEAVAQKVRSHM